MQTSSLSWKTEALRYNGSRKYSPEGRSETNGRKLQDARKLMKNTRPKMQGCPACEHGINVNLGRRHTHACRQTTLPFLVSDSLWAVTFDAHGTVLKRHERDDEVPAHAIHPQTA